MSEQFCEVSAAIDDGDDLHPVDGSVFGVRVNFVEHEIMPFDENPSGRSDIAPPRTEPGKCSQLIDTRQ